MPQSVCAGKSAHKFSRSTGCQAPCIPASCTASQCWLSATPCLLTTLPNSTPAVKVGLGVAAQEAVDVGMDTISTAIAKVATALRKGLQGVPGVTVQDRGQRLGGIVSFTAVRKRGWQGEGVLRSSIEQGDVLVSARI